MTEIVVSQRAKEAAKDYLSAWEIQSWDGVHPLLKAFARFEAATIAAARAEQIEIDAKIADDRACRAEKARGGMGQILADTQDQEAREITVAIRSQSHAW